MTTYIFRTNWRWVVAFSSFLQYVILLGSLYDYSILYLSFQQEFKTGAAATGWVGSLANALSNLLSPFTSWLLLRVSCRTGSVLGVISFSIGMFTTSYATELWHTFLSFGILTGLGGNFIIVADSTLLNRWFKGKYFYRAMALVTVGSSFGMMIMSFVLTSLISSCGWRCCLRIISAGSMIVGILGALTMRNPEPIEKQTRDVDTKAREETSTCETLLKHQLGKSSATSQCVVETRLCVLEKSANEDAVETRLATEECCTEKLESDSGDESFNWRKMLHFPDTWLYFTAVTLTNSAYTFAIVNMGSFMDDLEFTKEDTMLAISLFGGAECLGKLIMAAILNVVPFSLMYINVATCLVAAIIAGMMAVVDTLPTLVLCSFVFGLMRSSLYGLAFGGSKELFGGYGMAAVSAMATVPYGIGNLIAAPITGGLYDITGNYTLSLLVILASFVASSVCFLLIPLRRKIKWSDLPCVAFDAEDQDN